MNHYYHSQPQNRTIAVRLNGIQYRVTSDYERVPASAKLRGMAERGSIQTYLPQIQQDKTTGYKKLFFAQL
jgi:hypothetical protein